MEYRSEIDSREKKSAKKRASIARWKTFDFRSHSSSEEKYPPERRGSARISCLGAAFSTAPAARGGRSCRFAATLWMGSGSIFQAETSPNISKFLVIIFACNLHRVV
ncbi:hypothetical protein G3N57_18765 [Paraburkholderia sp. Se-20369]|nr:hypothetical protein [Paraburkholderia sp. Se-20369]